MPCDLGSDTSAMHDQGDEPELGAFRTAELGWVSYGKGFWGSNGIERRVAVGRQHCCSNAILVLSHPASCTCIHPFAHVKTHVRFCVLWYI